MMAKTINFAEWLECQLANFLEENCPSRNIPGDLYHVTCYILRNTSCISCFPGGIPIPSTTNPAPFDISGMSGALKPPVQFDVGVRNVSNFHGRLAASGGRFQSCFSKIIPMFSVSDWNHADSGRSGFDLFAQIFKLFLLRLDE